jgi:hypothetical protein
MGRHVGATVTRQARCALPPHSCHASRGRAVTGVVTFGAMLALQAAARAEPDATRPTGADAGADADAYAGASADAGQSPSTDAESDASSAVLTCDHVDGPGRVRCDIEARVSSGNTIAWGDVVILQTPGFLVPLRGRIGPHEATLQRDDLWRWPFALVARTTGTGKVDARVRLVVCQDVRCRPRTIDVQGVVVAGN